MLEAESWLGRETEDRDVLTSQLARRLGSVIGQEEDEHEQAAPLFVHWCLAPPAVGADRLGIDGHVKPGILLPPMPLPHRMWAGGRLTLKDRLRIGDEVTRRTRIADMKMKEGRSGRLCFLTLEHEISTARGVAVSERQDIVYRDAQRGASASPTEAAREARWQESFSPDPVLLFRYSALTFNSHRIHYDREYCATEGYPDLVVQGPLLATLLVEFAARIFGRAPRRFDFKGVAPLLAAGKASLNAREGTTKEMLDLWVEDEAGSPTMFANAWM